MYVLYACTKRTLRSPQNTLQSKSFRGHTPRPPSHNLYYGPCFLCLPWAPPILSVALYPAVSIVFSFPTSHRASLSCYMELQGQASLWLQLHSDMKLANHWRYWTSTELIIHTISPSWQFKPHQLPIYALTLKGTLRSNNGKSYLFPVARQIQYSGCHC